MKNRVVKFASESWRQYLLYGICIGLAVSIFLFRLFKLVPYASTSEIAARQAASSFEVIIQNPLFLPHKLLQFGFITAGFEGLLASRAVSAAFGMVATVFFYRVIRTWYTSRMAFLSSALFMTSGWLLHSARLATPTIMYVLSIALVWTGLRLTSNQPRERTLLIIALILLTLLFVPGFIWFILAAVVWQRRMIWQEVRRANKLLISVLVVSFLMALGLLGYAFVKDIQLLWTWLGIPATWSLRTIVTDLILTPYHVFFRAPFNPEMWLGRLPYINVGLSVLFGLGSYVLYRSVGLDRMRALIVMLAAGSVLASLGVVNLLIIMPFIFVAIAAGLALLLQQWFTVFPRNPIARGVGVICVGMLVGLTSYYHLYQYFEAWPKNPDTQSIFQIEPPQSATMNGVRETI